MRTMSISIKDELYEKLKYMIPTKQISKFVTTAVSKELSVQEETLKVAYLAAANDKEREEELMEWDKISD